MFILFNLATPCLDMYTEEIFMYVNKEAYTRVFMLVVLIIVKSKNNHKTNQ